MAQFRADKRLEVDFIPPDHPGFDYMIENDTGYPGKYDMRSNWSEYHDVGSGAWVYIANSPPVAARAKPLRHYIYWAIPVQSNLTVEYYDSGTRQYIRLQGVCVGRDQYFRQAVKVMTTEEVTLFTDEYSIVPEENLEEYRKIGYEMIPTGIATEETIDTALIEKGRVLCEEERELIWALQLDGLSESAACGEYFHGKYIDVSGRNMFYRPNSDLYKRIVEMYGD